MTDARHSFSPDWASPPGDTILDVIEERGWTQAEFSKRTGYSTKYVNQLINGKVPLTVDAALRLEHVLGGSVAFWLKREAEYQDQRARLESEEKYAEWTSWLDILPVKELMDVGALKKLRLDEKNKPCVVGLCLKFFGVASPDEWYAHYGKMKAQFRRSNKGTNDVGAVLAWLRLGEQQLEQSTIPKFDRAQFQAALREIRSMTCMEPLDFLKAMKHELSEAGVALIFVPAIPRARVSGVVRWVTPSCPLIQLSSFGKSNDRFWFTLFHEAAHILLHSGTFSEKKSVFLDDFEAGSKQDPKEQEADQWAANWLIPPQYRSELETLRSRIDAMEFAIKIGIHPGIGVGRLQHEALIPRSWMNDLKDFSGMELLAASMRDG